MPEDSVKTNPMREVEAMRIVSQAVEGLDASAIQRVLSWAAESHGVKTPPRRELASKSEDASHVSATENDLEGSSTEQVGHSEFADLFAEAQPKTGPDKAIVAAYWLQVVQKSTGFEGQTLNSELKNLGHGLTNVTTTMTSLMERTPALIMQIKKTGKANRARKLYKLTSAGIQQAKRLLKTSHGENKSDEE